MGTEQIFSEKKSINESAKNKKGDVGRLLKVLKNNGEEWERERTEKEKDCLEY